MSSSVRPLSLPAIALLGLCVPLAAQVRGHKLNDELAVTQSAGVGAFRVSSQGYVVFGHYKSSPFDLEISSVLASGQADPVKLNSGLNGSGAHLFALTRDEASAVFDNQLRLYVASIDGQVRREIGQFVGALEELEFSADGNWVVYHSVDHDPYTGQPYHHLYAARLDGTHWSGRTGTGNFEITPDSTHVVYQGAGLYSVGIRFSQAPQLLSAQSTTLLHVSPDGQHVLFTTAGISPDLFSIPIGGGTAVQLNPGTSFDPAWPSRVDGGFVTFIAKESGSRNLYRAPIDGSGPTLRLNPASHAPINDFQLLPGGAYVVYTQGYPAAQGALYRAPTDGSQVDIRLSGTMVPGGFIFQLQLTADGSRAVFTANREHVGVIGLYSAPTDGSAPPLHLSAPLVPGGNVQSDFELTPDGQGVFYRADLVQDERFELFATSVAVAGPSLRVNGDLAPGGNVVDFHVGPGGQRVFYRANQEDDGPFRPGLFGWDLASPGATYRLNELFYATVGQVLDFFPAPDGAHVVYHAQVVGETIPGLHSLSLQNYGSATDLTESRLSPRQDLGALGSFASQGRRFVYTTNYGGPLSPAGIFSSLLDGSAPPTQLADLLNLAQLSPDGEWVTFLESNNKLRAIRADGSGGQVTIASAIQNLNTGSIQASPRGDRLIYISGTPSELYSTKLDGSVAPIKISAPLVPSGSVRWARFSPDGAWVLYVADAQVAGQEELFRAAVDGSSPVVRLSGPMVVGGDVVWDFASSSSPNYAVFVTPDGTRVVYAADQETNDVTELYVVPLDGSAPPVRITQSAVNGALAWWDMDVGNQRAVYGAGAQTLTVLFSAPLDASSAPVQLSTVALSRLDPMPRPVLTPDERRVVFMVGAPLDSRLYSVVADGSAAPVLLSGVIPAGEQVYSFQLGADGRRVVFLVANFFPRHGDCTLYWIPVEGGQARSLTDLPADRFLSKYALMPDGNRVLYLADQDVLGRTELYESFLVPPHRPR